MRDDNEAIAINIIKDTRKRKDDESITDTPCSKNNKSINQNQGIVIKQDITKYFMKNQQEITDGIIAKDTRKYKEVNEAIVLTTDKDTRKRKEYETITDKPHIKKNKSTKQNPGISINQDITKYFTKKNKTNVSEMASSSNELSAYGPMDDTNSVPNMGSIPNPDDELSVLDGDRSHMPRLDFAPPQPGSRRYNPQSPPPQPGLPSPPARIACEVLTVSGVFPPALLAPHYLEHPT
jgi:hypothetical protein